MATIRMQITGVPAIVQVDMLDRGIPYNPLQQKPPDVTLPVQERAIGGLGIFMVRQTMDELCYRYENRYQSVKRDFDKRYDRKGGDANASAAIRPNLDRLRSLEAARHMASRIGGRFCGAGVGLGRSGSDNRA